MASESISFQVQLLQARVAELEAENQRLRQVKSEHQPASLLSTVARVANLLLRSSDYIAVLPKVVRLLGEAVGSDRCSIIQELDNTDVIHLLTEWCRPGVALTSETTPEMNGLMVWSNFASFHEQFARGEVANFIVSDIEEPARSILAAQGCTSLLVVPIMVRGRCWGQIGFDNCGETRLYDEAKIAILKVAADSIAAALERDLNQREQAAQDRAAQTAESNRILSLRERWLDVTAIAANELLSTTDLDSAVNMALRILGEGVDVDRVMVFQIIADPTGQTEGSGRILYGGIAQL